MGEVSKTITQREGVAPRETDPEITRRLSALPEDRILDYFWLMHRRGAEALGLLLQLTTVVITRPSSWDPAAVRREHEDMRGTGFSLEYRRCFACSGGGTVYRHHIVEVHHGGSNASRNQVPLCFDCHQYLHPWLREESAAASLRAGFESLHEIALRMGR